MLEQGQDVLGRALLGIALFAVLPAALSGQGFAQTPAFAASSSQTTDNTEPSLLLTAGEWRALASGNGASRLCYVAPVKAHAGPASRDARPVLYITHRPNRQSFDVVSFAAGYSFRADSMARVSFGNDPSYRLFTDGSFGWAGDEANDRRIVRAMSEAASITVTGLGADGHLHEDVFPLQGFAAAFQRASSECQRPGAPIKR